MIRAMNIHPSFGFLLKLILLYSLWNGLIAQTIVDHWITTNLAEAGVLVLKVAGLAAHRVSTGIYVQQYPLLYIGKPCNGVDFFGLFTCFVLAFPTRWKDKLWFLPIGILAIHLLNVLRVMALCINCWYFRNSFDFNHKYTFVILVYGLIFVLWMKWAQRYSLLKETKV